MKETINTDQTRQFLVTSRQKNVRCEIDLNCILVKAMSSQSNIKMIQAYGRLLQQLKQVDVALKKNVMDNKVSASTKHMIQEDYTMTLELVPPGYYQRNAAKVVIQNFKAHFLSVLAVIADNFHHHYGTGCYQRPS